MTKYHNYKILGKRIGTEQKTPIELCYWCDFTVVYIGIVGYSYRSLQFFYTTFLFYSEAFCDHGSRVELILRGVISDISSILSEVVVDHLGQTTVEN